MFDLFINVLVPSLISSVAWGIGPYFTRRSMKLLNNQFQIVFLFNLMFGGIGAFIMFLFLRKHLIIDIYEPNTKKAFGLIVLSSISSLMLGYYFFYKALSKSKYTSLVVKISYVLPLIIIALMTHFVLNEYMNIGMVCGMSICIFGIGVFVYFSK